MKILPEWYVEMFKTTISIISHNQFFSFRHLKNFIEAALQFKPNDKDDLKHIKVICTNKGEKDNLIYLTIDIFVKFKEKKK